MDRKGMLIVISGFSGSGKGTIMKKLIADYDHYSLSVSATTRSPRPGEVDGKDYFFVTKEKFFDMIRNGEFLEYAGYVDNFYGTPKSYVEQEMAKGRDVILEIEMQGALMIKAKYPETILVFVTPPNVAELEKRLRSRGTETEEVICKRLEKAAMEAEGIESYDYILVNDDLEAATKRLNDLIRDQHERVQARLDFVKTIRDDLRTFFVQQHQ